ncbi:ABC transporter permease subunit [Planctomonas psychrotolerans]|uniref:ABC transporter permease subunit n=1 Tax=Planctomonas psychrotolerans TaxID=2528712 RepID=UPI00123A62BA|nr:ABC transporter permease subunit [Planctomonas psychrotolerans]
MASKPLPLFRRAIADSWRSMIGWSLGVMAALLLYLPLFPSIGGSPDMLELLDSLPPELVNAIGYDQIATGAGYTQSTFYGLIGFLLLTIAGTSWGTAAIAGDEETGSLELTLAHGVSRTQLVLERTAAVVVRLAWLGLLSALVVLALNDSAELGIEPAHAFAAAAALVGLTLLSATVAVVVGALTGRRLFATAAGAGVAVLGYALNAIANQSEDLDPLHAWSPYHWAYGARPLADGVDWGGLGLLYGISAALVLLAVVALNRRDVTG